MIAAIETSTPVCSVSVETAGGRITEKRIEGRGVHSSNTFLFLEELMERYDASVSDLEAILFSGGPGSYTGLRIGAAAIKGLLFGRDIPLYVCPTLIAFAAGAAETARSGRKIHGVIDARRNHLYRQTITADGQKADSAGVVELEAFRDELSEGDTVIGTGWERIPGLERQRYRFIATEGVSASSLIKAYRNEPWSGYFEKADPETFEPDYITMSQVNNLLISD